MKTQPIIFEHVEPGQYPVQLTRRTKNTFGVTYGAHVKKGLSYEAAARELGECIFHALACNGKIDA